MLDFCEGISDMLTVMKFAKFEMEGYAVLHDSIKILDFENLISKIKVRLVLHRCKQDLSDLKDIYNELV